MCRNGSWDRTGKPQTLCKGPKLARSWGGKGSRERLGPPWLPAGGRVQVGAAKAMSQLALKSQTAEPPGAPGAYSMGGDGLPMGEQSHSGQEPLESVSSKPDPKTWVMLAVVPEKGASL